MTLATLGQPGREAFERFVAQLIDADVPKSLKVDWNDCIATIAGATPIH